MLAFTSGSFGKFIIDFFLPWEDFTGENEPVVMKSVTRLESGWAACLYLLEGSLAEQGVALSS